MAALDLPAGYSVTRTRAGYALRSPYGPLGDDFDCWAEACFAAQDHADSLALEASDEVAAVSDFEAQSLLEAA
ncbi:hypothetical protein [Methylobacterium pseudosasicola]|uniref:Uncharacterized protein n=1 Tax=Methylobacterium pseudosasicola TaxID=582667 RepID=A0A1I4US73_9HYPH|nr:hypothetical protein [Methylobacterium pseudosasicola]SFM91583.1 hypothetical protein SAMN05192568_107524 [Methylobacterium pseudosasicola]